MKFNESNAQIVYRANYCTLFVNGRFEGNYDTTSEAWSAYNDILNAEEEK